MRRKVLAAQDVSRMCNVCGVENARGLHARFLELEGGELFGVFAGREEHQGYPGRLHGGIASALLDETIGRSISVGGRDVWGVTLELSVRFRKPVPLDGEIRAIGRIAEIEGRVFHGTGEILLDDGTVAVEARGKYLQLPLERIADADVHREIIPDELPVPDDVEL